LESNVAYFAVTFKAQNAVSGLIDSLPALPNFTPGLLQPNGPVDESTSVRILARRLGSEATPDLASQGRVVIEKADSAAFFRSHRRRGNSTGTCANNDHIETVAHPVTTSIPAAQANWQVR
jgi:hypothetical protein